jgi:hypothetical protein
MKIIIAHPNSNPRRAIKNLSRNSVWFSFNEDKNKIDRWEKRIPDFSQRLDVARDMERIYDDVYKKYSSLMADFAARYKDCPEWWLSPVPDKRGWPPRYVVNNCIISYLEKLLKEKKHDEIIILTSSRFILSRLKNIASSESIKCLVYGHHHYFFGRFRMNIMRFLELVYFGYEFVKNKTYLSLYYRDTSLQDLKGPNIYLLRTYCHESFFKEDGSYTETYYGDMRERLRKRGYTVVYQPNLSSVRNKRNAHKWFNRSRDRFWVLEKYLTLYDLIKAYKIMIKQLLIARKLGHGISSDLEPFSLLTTGRNYLKSLVPVKLREQGISPTHVLFDWENSAYEKYMCILFKQNLPHTRIIGYLSGTPLPTGPRVNLIPKEAKITPIPDKIVCCGKYAYDWLVHTGYDKKKLAVGPSFRQGHVFNPRGYQKAGNSILVALPFNHKLSLELLREMIRYAKRNPEHRLLVKPHPYINVKRILSKNIPGNMSIVHDDISELFRRCRYFVYTGPTTTACEAFVLGKNVCRFISNNFFSMDCLYFKFNNSRYGFTKSEELEGYVSGKKQVKPKQEQYKQYIFGRADKDYVDIFM